MMVQSDRRFHYHTKPDHMFLVAYILKIGVCKCQYYQYLITTCTWVIILVLQTIKCKEIPHCPFHQTIVSAIRWSDD